MSFMSNLNLITMKKIFLTLALAVITIAASAQIKTVDIKGDLRNDFGLGVGVTTGITSNIDFAPSFNFYFVDAGHFFTVDADFHYNFNLGNDFSAYPLVGASLMNSGAKGFDSVTKLGVNLGGGVKYAITDKLGIFAECKYQWVEDFDDTFFALGVNIKL